MVFSDAVGHPVVGVYQDQDCQGHAALRLQFRVGVKMLHRLRNAVMNGDVERSLQTKSGGQTFRIDCSEFANMFEKQTLRLRAQWIPIL